MKINFEGQVVLITGATRGIGKQLANDFHELGAELILTGTRNEEIEALNKSRGELANPRRQYYCVNFLDADSTEKFLGELGSYGRIDVCVNNAGMSRIEYIDETTTKDWDDIVTVNLKAPYLVTREISTIMKRNGYGRIVNIGSIFGSISREKRSIYSVSKFGLRGLTTGSSNELARYNILVNTVSPGFVLTERTKRVLSKEEMTELASQVPIKRFATPDEISKLILFLASGSNTYITGQNIIIDGGYVNV